MEFSEDGNVIQDGHDVITFIDGTTEDLPFKDYDHFRHDHMCDDGPLWFIAKKKGRAGAVWYNTDQIKKIDMNFNSEEVSDAVRLENMADEVEASVVGVGADGKIVYADEVHQPSPFDFMSVITSMIANGQAVFPPLPEEEDDGTIPGPDGD